MVYEWWKTQCFWSADTSLNAYSQTPWRLLCSGVCGGGVCVCAHVCGVWGGARTCFRASNISQDLNSSHLQPASKSHQAHYCVFLLHFDSLTLLSQFSPGGESRAGDQNGPVHTRVALPSDSLCLVSSIFSFLYFILLLPSTYRGERIPEDKLLN